MKTPPPIVIGADHAGYALKEFVKTYLVALNFDVNDCGPGGEDSVDYTDFGCMVAEGISSGRFERGVLICGTGQGMAMSANKVPGVRAAVVADTFSAAMAMQHNDARVLCIGERVVGPGLAMSLLDAWLGAEFEGGRHARRVGKIEGTG